MKKIYLIAILNIFCIALFSQKGILVGGNIAYNNKKTENNLNPTSTFEITPIVAYLFSPKWGTGLRSSFAINTDANNESISKFEVGPFVRYTMHVNDVFGVYSDFTTTYKEQQEYPGTNTGKFHGFCFYIDPTIFINVKNGFGLNFSFGGLDYSNYGTNNNMTSNLNLSLGKAIKVGVSKTFATK